MGMMNEVEYEYQAENFALIRVPLKKAEEFTKAHTITLDEMINDPAFLEALGVASIDLAQAVDKYKQDKIVRKHLYESVLNYYLRFITRTTPFGLFAGVSTVNFREHTNIQLNSLHNIQKCCEVDVQWLYGLIKQLENDSDILRGLKIKFNDICYEIGNKIKNPAVNNYGQKYVFGGKTNVQLYRSMINNSKQIQNIKKITKDYIDYKEVVFYMQQRNKDIEIKKINDFIIELIKAEYLITDLRPPITSSGQLEYLINKLKPLKLNTHNEELLSKLILIQKKIIEYTNLELGSGYELYKSIVKMMQTIVKATNYLSISTGVNLDENEISNKIQQNINAFSRMLVKGIDYNNEPTMIRDLKIKFKRKYGEYVEVALLELIDPIQGLGNPYGQDYIREGYIEESDTAKRKELLNYLKREMLYAIKTNHREVEIKENEIGKIANKYRSNLPLSYSFELSVFIRHASNKEELYIAPNKGSYKAGDCFNRFSGLLSKEIRTELYNINEEETIYNQEYIIASLCEILPNGHSNNICIGDRHYSYTINLCVPSGEDTINIPLNDLLIGYDPRIDRLYIKSRKFNKKIKVVSDNMLNPLANSNIANILLWISRAYYLHPLDFIIQLKEIDFEYMPRIRYGNVILQEEIWQIKRDNFSEDKKIFIEQLKKWCHDLKVPKYVYISSQDRRIIVCSQNEDFFENIFKKINSQKIVTLEGCEIKEIDELIAKNEKEEHYFSELVIPLKLCGYSDKNKIVKKMKPDPISFCDEKRIKYMGDDGWIFFSIYIEEARSNEFIGEYVYRFISRIENKIEKWFFIRYSDPKYHIRLRLKVKKNLMQEILLEYQKWYKNVRTMGISYEYSITPYNQEIERYGNVKSIGMAEKVFWADSILVAKICNIYTRILKSDEGKAVCVEGCYLLLRNCQLSDEDIEKILEPVSFKEIGKKEFLKNKIVYEKILEQGIYADKLYQEYSNRKKEIEGYINLINREEKLGTLYNEKKDIILSLVHMFCNRFNGDREWEMQMLSIIRYGLHIKNSKRNYLKKRQNTLIKTD